MAGPTNVQTNITLIGTGYKLTNRTADFKWGIEAVQNIPRANINDYTYNLEGFLNYHAGSQILKAYKDEVTNIKKVDTSITDDSVLDLTKQTDKLYDAEGIREGPGYIEAGLKYEISAVVKSADDTNSNSRRLAATSTVSMYEFQ